MSEDTATQTGAFDDYCCPFVAETNSDTNAFHRPACFAQRQSPSLWLHEAIAKLQNLSTLAENWDSYGALPIDRTSITWAGQHLYYLAHCVGVGAPAIGGGPDGHVGFSWDDGAWSLDAEILPNGQIQYVYLDERDSKQDREARTFVWSDLLEFLTQWPQTA